MYSYNWMYTYSVFKLYLYLIIIFSFITYSNVVIVYKEMYLEKSNKYFSFYQRNKSHVLHTNYFNDFHMCIQYTVVS